MLNNKNIERQCRYRLARHNLKVHKLKGSNGQVYYAYEIGEDDSPPNEVTGRYMNLSKLIEFAEKLKEKEAEYKVVKGRPWPTRTI